MSTKVGFPGFLAGAVGEGSDHRLPSAESVGRVLAVDAHDAGCNTLRRFDLAEMPCSQCSACKMQMITKENVTSSILDAAELTTGPHSN